MLSVFINKFDVTEKTQCREMNRKQTTLSAQVELKIKSYAANMQGLIA